MGKITPGILQGFFRGGPCSIYLFEEVASDNSSVRLMVSVWTCHLRFPGCKDEWTIEVAIYLITGCERQFKTEAAKVSLQSSLAFIHYTNV